MKKHFILVLMAAIAISCTPKNADNANTGEAKKVAEASGAVFLLDTELSKIHWRGTKPSGEHVGTVKASKGNLNVDEGKLTGGTFTIDLNSIVCDDLEGEWNAKLVGHLKSEDFFYTEMYPEATFEIVSVSDFSAEAEEEMNLSHSITGNLTMRGVTKSITFPAEVSVSEGLVSAKTNEFSIDRTLWGVNFKSKSIFAEFKDDFIGDMINLKLDVVFAAK